MADLPNPPAQPAWATPHNYPWTAFLGLIASGLLAANIHAPKPAEEKVLVPKVVVEQDVRMVEYQIEIDGKVRTVLIPLHVPSAEVIYREQQRFQQPSSLEMLKFWILFGFSIFLGIYSIYVLFTWLYLHRTGRDYSRRFEMLSARLNHLLLTVVGALVAFLGVSHLTQREGNEGPPPIVSPEVITKPPTAKQVPVIIPAKDG